MVPNHYWFRYEISNELYKISTDDRSWCYEVDPEKPGNYCNILRVSDTEAEVCFTLLDDELKVKERPVPDGIKLLNLSTNKEVESDSGKFKIQFDQSYEMTNGEVKIFSLQTQRWQRLLVFK